MKEAKDRWPRLRTSGPGYETSGREKFDYQVEFVFNYSDILNKNQQLKKLADDFASEIDKIKKSGSSKGVISQAFAIFPNTTALDDDMSGLAKITSAELKSSIKQGIGGRVETGRMKSSIYGVTTKHKGSYTSSAGWLKLWYKYFGFQENGTKTVSPMHSIIGAYLKQAPEVQKTLIYYFKNYGSKRKG